MSAFTAPPPRVVHSIKTGEPLAVRGYVPLLKGATAIGRRLVCTDTEDRFYVIDQTAGTLAHVLGPGSLDDAIAAAERVLAGRERSVTGDGLLAVAGLVAMAMPKEAAP